MRISDWSSDVCASDLVLVLPLAAVFVEAFRKGFGAFYDSVAEPDALAAMKLTLLVAAIAVPLNMIFGVTASWAVTKFDFRRKSFLITLIDLHFTVLPVVSDLNYSLLFGRSIILHPRLRGSAAGVVGE